MQWKCTARDVQWAHCTSSLPKTSKPISQQETTSENERNSELKETEVKYKIRGKFYRQILSFDYIVLFSSETSAPGSPGSTWII